MQKTTINEAMSPNDRLNLVYRAALAAGLNARNWSAGDNLCLALYNMPGDSYLGTVEIAPQGKWLGAGNIVRQGESRWTKLDRPHWEALLIAVAAALREATS